jgi:hypothetical protein
VADQGNLLRERLAELMTTQSEAEANIVKGILEESAIDCTLIAQVPHSVYPFTVDGLAAIQIMVLSSQLEAAQTVLRDYKADIETDPLP